MDHAINIEEKFVMPAGVKMWSMILIAAGLLGIILSFVVYKGDEGTVHVWATLLTVAVFFSGHCSVECIFSGGNLCRLWRMANNIEKSS